MQKKKKEKKKKFCEQIAAYLRKSKIKSCQVSFDLTAAAAAAAGSCLKK